MGDHIGDGGSGAGSGSDDGDARETHLAAAAAAGGSGSGSALSVEALPFHPPQQQQHHHHVAPPPQQQQQQQHYHHPPPPQQYYAAPQQQQLGGGGPQMPLPFLSHEQQQQLGGGGPQMPLPFLSHGQQFQRLPEFLRSGQPFFGYQPHPPYMPPAAQFGPPAAMGVPEHRPSYMHLPMDTSSGSGSRPPPFQGTGSSSSPTGLGSGPPPSHAHAPSSSHDGSGLGQSQPAPISLQNLHIQTPRKLRTRKLQPVDNLNLPQTRAAYMSLSVQPGSQPGTAPASGSRTRSEPSPTSGSRSGPSPASGSRSGPSSVSGARPPKPSYSTIATYGNETAADLNMWKTKILTYLTRDDSYKNKALTSGAQLEVEFLDVLMSDKKLAVKLCNAQGANDFWLSQAAAVFFRKSGVSTAGNVSFLFKDWPTSLTTATQALQAKALSKHVKVCKSEVAIDVATTYGRQTLSTIICGTLGKLAKGESYGDLSIDDLMLAGYANGETKLIITKVPVVNVNSSVGERLDNLWAVWRAVQPLYLIVDQLPLYFERLQMDLLTAPHLDDWFVQYIQYHPVFYACNPRKTFICGIEQELSSNPPRALSSVLYVPPYGSDDWRQYTQNGVLHQIFSYQERKDQERKAKEQKLKGAAAAAPAPMNSYANQYADNAISLLNFHRNALQHPYENSLTNKDELELLLAATFEDFLPDMLRRLLSMCNMARFSSDWSTYKASKYDDMEPPFGS